MILVVQRYVVLFNARLACTTCNELVDVIGVHLSAYVAAAAQHEHDKHGGLNAVAH